MHYRDLEGTTHTTTWDEVFASSKRIQDYFNAIRLRFVERDDLIRKLKYAFMMREHVLLDGPTGAGKSAILNMVLDHITGAEVWSMDMTKFTTDTHLFGAYDVREMKESGQLVHMTDGSLLKANFGKGGEFLDASDPTLRTLLAVMNERKVRRGPAVYAVPLISFVGDTNFRIDELPGRRQQLAAVLDRFLFQCTVDYVSDARNRYTMLEMALDAPSRAELPPLSLEDIIRVSGVIQENDLVEDRYVREAYQDMTLKFSEARKKAGRAPLSDRRFIKAAQIMEVGAVLHGRNRCTFDDLQFTSHVLIQHPDDAPLFETAKNEALAIWVVKAQRREIEAEVARLQEIVMRVPTVDCTKLNYAELQKFSADLQQILASLQSFEPQSLEVRKEHTRHWSSIQGQLASLDLHLIQRLVSSLPTLADTIPDSDLKPFMQQTQHVESELRRISPKSDTARIDLAKALEVSGQAIARLQVEFMGK